MDLVMDHQELQERIRKAPSDLIAARIKRARKEHGTHDTLGAAIGSNRSHIIKLEKGQRPHARTLLRIAEATGRDPLWFVDPEVDPSPFPDESDGDGRRAA